MKVEKISPDKFRITFTHEDLMDFGINFDDLKYDSDDAQEIFWNLIELADIDGDFFDENAQFVVEAVVTKNEGLTMVVTRIVDNFKKTSKIKNKKDKYKKACDISPLIFSFDDFEVLVSAGKRVENTYAGISSLYKMDGEYYLVMDAAYEKVALSTELLLCEYGKKIQDSYIAAGRLEEYGNLLISNTAIVDISANF